MLRFGSNPPNIREMSEDEVLLSRLELLIIMSKAYLEDCPLGKHRKEAVLRNAQRVAHVSPNWGSYGIQFRSNDESREEMDFGHVFHQRVQLLTLMTKSFVEEYPMGRLRKKALKDNVDRICQAVMFSGQMSGMKFLKVA